jgi:short-subunit dehydrogenase
MNAIGKAARVELQWTGVHVLTVCPGYIATNFNVNKTPGREPRRLNSDSQVGASAEQVARDTLNAYLKGKREVYTPWYYWMVAKLYQLCPGLVEWGMARRLKRSN